MSSHRPGRTLFPLLLIGALLGTPGAWAQSPSPIDAGRAAMTAGDSEQALALWEQAAAAHDAAAYPLLVDWFENGPERNLALAFKWAWIGLARTADPALRAHANSSFDRLQNAANRNQRMDGKKLADQWLAEHPAGD